MLTDRIARYLDIAGLQVLEPFVRLVAREEPGKQVKNILLFIGVPLIAFSVFLLGWAAVSQTIVTKYGTLPTPTQVWNEAGNLIAAHKETRAAEVAFYQQQEEKATKFETAAALSLIHI